MNSNGRPYLRPEMYATARDEAAPLLDREEEANVVERLLTELNQLDLDELERIPVTWIEETALTRPLREVGGFTSLIAAAGRAGAAADHDLELDLLRLVASRAWWVDPGQKRDSS